MSALAQVLVQQGHIVIGADNKNNYYTCKNLKNIKLESFKSMKLKKSYFYIIGNAYVNSNIGRYIKEMYPISMSYSEFIPYYFSSYNLTTVSGSHGKTTTTKMLSTILDNHSYIIGDGTGNGNSRNNLILEACEYKNNFLNYKPDILLLLNIDYDHPDFFKNEEEYIEAFQKMVNQSKVIIANGDDKNIQKIKNERFITFGMKSSNDIIFTYKYDQGKMKIKIMDEEYLIPFIGEHFVYDFVGSCIVCKIKGKTKEDISKMVYKLEYPKRRMEIKLRGDAVLLCDYAHHPTEIKSVYNSVSKMFPDRKIKCYFQPHTLSRSYKFKEEFKLSLSNFDEVNILKTFTSVREEENKGLEKEILDFWGYDFVENKDVIYNQCSNKIYLFLGAGDIYDLFEKL